MTGRRGRGGHEAATERVLCGDGVPRSALARRCRRRPLPQHFFNFFSCSFFLFYYYYFFFCYFFF